MYKISEEDSQDEEVLNSLSAKVSQTNNGVTTGLRVKPIPPAKPAFLRKAVVTGFGGVGNSNANVNANQSQFPFPRPQPTSSASDLAKTRHPTAIQAEEEETNSHQDWPSSTETPTGESDDDSEQVSMLRDVVKYSLPGNLTDPASTSQVSPNKKVKRHKIRGNVSGSEVISPNDNDSTQSEASFCSSCDERESDHSDYDGHSEDDGSYYDDGSSGHPESGSDLDFDSESDTLFEEELASLL